MHKKIIGVLVGSARKAAFSKQLARNLCKLVPDELEMRLIAIAHLPIYNQDYDDENRAPDEYMVFRQEIKSMAGFVFVTPEYNRSMPALLKNALDIGSRPYEQNCWAGKPAGVVSISPGAIGGFGANHHLRQSAATVNLAVMPQPEAYISNAAAIFDQDGNLDAGVADFLQNYNKAFARWVARF